MEESSAGELVRIFIWRIYEIRKWIPVSFCFDALNAHQDRGNWCKVNGQDFNMEESVTYRSILQTYTQVLVEI